MWQALYRHSLNGMIRWERILNTPGHVGDLMGEISREMGWGEFFILHAILALAASDCIQMDSSGFKVSLPSGESHEIMLEAGRRAGWEPEEYGTEGGGG